jgi:FkbM family methyltransferase
VDVGANVGYYTLLASRLVGDQGGVIAVEAAPWMHDVLKQQLVRNAVSNVRTVQAAAGAEIGQLRLYRGDAGNLGSAHTISQRAAGEVGLEVTTLPLSAILSEDEIRRVRVVKIDVEGAELSVLRGLESVMHRMRRDVEILVEISPELMADGEKSARLILSLMRSKGFQSHWLENDYSWTAYLSRGTSAESMPLVHHNVASQTDVVFSRKPTSKNTETEHF